MSLTKQLKTAANELGFELTGVCHAGPSPGYEHFTEWLDRDYAGQMKYLEDRRQAYQHPERVLEGVRSLLMLGFPYYTLPAEVVDAGQGRVSRYAWGETDYHSLIREQLHQLADKLKELEPEANTRCVIDTAPLLERDFARLAGLGWIGKNTLLINKPRGSWFFLAALLTDIELEADEPFTTDHCGTCTACLDACPTDAFPQPYVLNASRCISYLTIEHRSPIDTELRSQIGEWAFGCDVCQDVCPWNRKAEPTTNKSLYPLATTNPLDLLPLFDLDDAGFRARFRKTPLWRAHRNGLLRNAAMVLGNRPTPKAIEPLRRALNDEDAMVRGAAAWALGKHVGSVVIEALRERAKIEPDEQVQAELQAAIAELTARLPATPGA